jgi:hypothetical protein
MMPNIPRKDIPAFVRKCWQAHRTATEENREAYEERLRFYVGGELQWRDEERSKRRNQGRPFITINKCKPACDQIEGGIRQNPPGPKVLPVGQGADADTADINAGLIRETEHRSGAKMAYSNAGKYQAAGGEGYFELATEWVDDYSFAQQLVVRPVEDPACIFFDPTARMLGREDAGWCGKLKTYQREEYIAQYGENRKVLKYGTPAAALGWIQEAMGIEGNRSSINEWTSSGNGPYYVAEFWLVELNPAKLLQYADNVARFDDEPLPLDAQGNPIAVVDGPQRIVNRRTIRKYVVDALEILDDTDWLDDVILPIFPALGPEIYIDGKLHRMSLISGAMDAQRALNYVATTATELAGLMPKAPFIGFKGQFEDPRWQSANTEVWAYLEIEPAFATDPVSGQSTLLPAPQRNTWETPIQWLIALWGAFSDSIKAVTSIYDPSLGTAKEDQSGVAINALRSESSVGNFCYEDNLNYAVERMYNSMVRIFPKIYSGSRVVTIVRPDSQHELVEINKEFADGRKTRGGSNGYWLSQGHYAVVVTVGPSYKDRQEQTAETMIELIKVAPQIAGAPGTIAKLIRSVANGDPELEGLADQFENQQPGDPRQLQMQLQQAMAQNQALMQIVQKLQFELKAKLPEQESKRFQALIDSATKIKVEQIKHGTATAGHAQDTIEHLTTMAHETALEHTKQQHERTMAETAASIASAQSAQDAEQQKDMAPQV